MLFLFMPIYAVSASLILIKTKETLFYIKDPNVILILRYLICFCTYKMFNVLTKHEMPKMTLHRLIMYISSGGIIFGSTFCMTRSAIMMPLYIYSSLVAISPILSAAIARVVIHDKMTFQQGIGAIIALSASMIPIVFTSNSVLSIENLYVYKYPIMLNIIGLLFNSTLWLTIRYISKMSSIFHENESRAVMQYASLSTAMIGFIVGVTVNLDSLIENQQFLFSQPSLIWNVVLLSSLSSLVCGNLYLYWLKKYTISFTAIISSISIGLDSLIGSWILGEEVNWLILPAMIMSIIGLTIYTVPMERIFGKTAK